MRGDEAPEPQNRGAGSLGLSRLLLDGAASLFPGYFALVMATGVVSIACHFMGLRPVALALIGVNWIAWPVLWGLTILRAVRFRALLLRDISDHQRAPGFFTIVAGTCVLGTQNVVVIGATGVGAALWWLGLILWFAIMYTFFTAVTVRARKPTLARGINGAWLIAAVSTQSVVVLRGVIDVGAAPPEAIQFQVIAMFLIGCMLYLAIIPLIFYRLTFVPMNREDFSPPYWINMGAVASWWIPFLFGLMLWRYVWMRDRFTYEPAIWGMVFPLGMYTTSTYQFDRAMGYGFLDPIPEVLVYVALTAWVLGMVGLLRRIRAGLRRPRAPL